MLCPSGIQATFTTGACAQTASTDEFDCKHWVAALLEYLRRIETGQTVSGANRDDPRLKLLEDKAQDDEEIDEKTVTTPEVARKIVDRRQLASGDIQAIWSSHHLIMQPAQSRSCDGKTRSLKKAGGCQNKYSPAKKLE